MINLVKNSIKFTTHGHIFIKAAYDYKRGSLDVQVEDTGIGIAEENIGGFFTRQGKLQSTAEVNSTGIGLGLTFVKHIVENSGGEVNVQSDGIGKGSRFSFNL